MFGAPACRRRKTFARIAGFLLTLPALGADARVRTLYDSDLDGWRLWTAYGPAVNERYGSGNNSKYGLAAVLTEYKRGNTRIDGARREML